MPLYLNGTEGVYGVNGTNSTPANRGSDTNTGIVYGTDTVQIATGGTTAVTVDSSQNVGIGVTPSAWTRPAIQNGAAGSVSYFAATNIGVMTSNVYFDGSNKYIATNPAVQYSQGSGQHSWSVAASGTAGNPITFTQAMTLDASRNLLVGTTSVGAYTGAAVTLSRDSGTTKWAVGPTAGTPTNFWVASSGSTGVYLNGTSATSWSSNSDERIKENLIPITNALEKTLTLRTVIGNFIGDTTKTPHPFLIAQDVLAVLPEAVDTSNQDKYGLAYSEVIPLAIAAIKELSAKLDAATARIAALEAK